MSKEKGFLKLLDNTKENLEKLLNKLIGVQENYLGNGELFEYIGKGLLAPLSESRDYIEGVYKVLKDPEIDKRYKTTKIGKSKRAKKATEEARKAIQNVPYDRVEEMKRLSDILLDPKLDLYRDISDMEQSKVINNPFLDPFDKLEHIPESIKKIWRIYSLKSEIEKKYQLPDR